ncbi:MAG: right-handed parallel beta-helix repeat-containing protein [Gallionellaceae bacterium]
MSSQSLTCVGIHGGADPRLRRNRIYDGEHGGIAVYDNGQGTLEDNDIFGNAKAGVTIFEGGNPTLRRNRITNNNYEAIWIYEDGQGVFEENDLRGNKKGAWDIAPECLDKVTRTRNQE